MGIRKVSRFTTTIGISELVGGKKSIYVEILVTESSHVLQSRISIESNESYGLTPYLN